MYYFEILNLLKENEDEKLSASEIFFLLSAENKVNSLNVKRVLSKMYIKNKHIEREWRTITTLYGKTWKEYVYYYSD